jgi:DNA-binding SARP family transcriptional activator/tetratricopeptide (TPR) repeat protein
MEFRVLGPLEVRHEERSVPLGGRMQQAVLALLLMHANEVVFVDQLIDELWGGLPPATGRAVIHSYVSRLRKLLEPVGRERPARQILLTPPLGYRLELQPEQLDLHRFERLVDQACHVGAQGHLEDAADGLQAALALWRGPALAGIGVERLRAHAHRLEERRLNVLEEWIDLELRLGHHNDLVAQVEELVATHPFREGLVGQLMRALCMSGRQADALNVYQAARRTLVQELGIEPGPALQQLQRAILRSDPSVALAASGPARSARPREAAVPPPCQLPPGITDFVGRRDALGQATCLVEQADGPPAPTVTVITGKAGVGKTAFAVHLAHQIRSRYPDGQLFVDLRAAETNAADPAEVLVGFLCALGVDRGALPQGLNDRVGLYRSLLADRRVLVLLDNATCEAQVRPLLPSGAGCATLVTSRARLAGFAGARILPLDVFQTDEALELLAKVVGRERVAQEPEAARAIVACCGCLPLAVRIAAAKLAARPERRMQTLAGRLRDEHRRLHELRVGDLEVRASIALGYQSHPDDTRRAFRLLGLVHAATFPAWLVAALLDRAVAAGEELTERLVDAGLLETSGEDEAGQVRYRFHDLLRAFARERLQDEEPADVRDHALQRAARAYLARAQGATNAWFTAERDSLAAMVEQTHGAGLWELTWQLALAASGSFEAHSSWDTWRRTHELALDAARRAADHHAEASVMRRLGDLHLDQSDWSQALARFTASRSMFRDLGDRHGEAQALCGLGDTYREQGQLGQALTCFTTCLPILRAVGDGRGQAEALRSLGIIFRQQGRLDDALAQLKACLRMSCELGDPRWEAIVRRSLGMVYRDQGRLDDARACLERCLATLRELDDRLWQAYTLNGLGQVLREQGALEDACSRLTESVAIFQQLHDRCGEGWALQALGDVLRDQGRLNEAQAILNRSLTTFRQLGHEPGEAYSLQSLGEVLRRAGRLDEAHPLIEHALGLARKLALHPCQARAQASLDAIVAWSRPVLDSAGEFASRMS